MTASHLTACSLALLLAAPLSQAAPVGDRKLPLTGLSRSVLAPNLCVLKYRVSTASPECQTFFDQGLGYFYSYVWMEAARSFETALQHDPDCAMAWWGLSRALERYGKKDPATKALLKAGELRNKASWREPQLILANLQEKGQVPGVGDAEARKKAAITTLDTCWRSTTTTRRAGTPGPRLPAARGCSAARSRPCPSTRPCCASTRCTPAPTTSWFTSTRLAAGRPSAGPTPRNTSSPRPASRTPTTCRPTWRPASAAGKRPSTGRAGGRAGAGLSQAAGGQAQRGPAVFAPPGHPAGVADPRRPIPRSPRHQGGDVALRLQAVARLVQAAPGRARLGRGAEGRRPAAQERQVA